ncbi:MAG: hypothetical protein GX493_00170 [Firmicutes bacterium]|nr:hypothetical protein [Bacillota bacterium]
MKMKIGQEGHGDWSLLPKTDGVKPLFTPTAIHSPAGDDLNEGFCLRKKKDPLEGKEFPENREGYLEISKSRPREGKGNQKRAL